MFFRSILERRDILKMHYQERTINSANLVITEKTDKLLSYENSFLYKQHLMNSFGLLSYDKTYLENEETIKSLFFEGKNKFYTLLKLVYFEQRKPLINLVKELVLLLGNNFNSIELLYLKHGQKIMQLINLLIKYYIIFPSKYHVKNCKSNAYSLYIYSPEIILFLLNINSLDTFKKSKYKDILIEQFVVTNYIKSIKKVDMTSIKVSCKTILDKKSQLR